MMKYDKRNRENLAKLADHTKEAALKWYDYLIKNNIEVLIYSTIRTVEEQKANVAKGVSQTMKSYHIVGQALDFVPIVNGKEDWNGYASSDVKKAIAEAKRLDFEWGGDWKGFVDRPHLQFNYKGYGTDTFGKAAAKEVWLQESGSWYFYVDGKKQTGWVLDYEKWYYLNPNGDMRLGWLQDGDKWYYLDTKNGDMKIGWVKDKGKWYYLDEKGVMKTGRITVAGKEYFLQSNGALLITDKDGVIQNG